MNEEGVKKALEERIEKLTVECSNIARGIEALKEEERKQQDKLDEGVKELEELHEALDELGWKPLDTKVEEGGPSEEAKPKEKTAPKERRKRGRPPVAPEDKKVITPEQKSEYDRARYAKRKSKKSEGTEMEKKARDESLIEINEKARAQGTSYGKYLAAIEAEKRAEASRLEREERHAREAAEKELEAWQEQQKNT